MIDIKNCPTCKSENIKIIRKIEYHYPREIKNHYVDRRLRIAFDSIFRCDRKDILLYKVYQCENCKLMFLNPRLNDVEASIVNENLIKDFKFKTPKIENISPFDIEKEKRIRELTSKYMDKEAQTILDYGGADGRMCIYLRDKYKCQVMELTKYIMHEGIEYLGDNMECLKNRQYDMILLSHVLEHLHAPLESLIYLRNHLKLTSGIIIISVPAGYINEWKNGIREPLTHCNFYNQDSLKKTLDIAGYKCLEMKEYPSSSFGEIYYVGEIGESK